MSKKLSETSKKEAGIISSIEGGHASINKLELLGIRPGKKFRKVSSQAFKGPIVINIDGRNIAIGHGLAQKVIVNTTL